MLRYSITQRLGLLRRIIISERAYVKVKSAWRSEGLYEEEASVVCRTVLISCAVLEKTERTCCNVTDSTSPPFQETNKKIVKKTTVG